MSSIVIMPRAAQYLKRGPKYDAVVRTAGTNRSVEPRGVARSFGKAVELSGQDLVPSNEEPARSDLVQPLSYFICKMGPVSLLGLGCEALMVMRLLQRYEQ